LTIAFGYFEGEELVGTVALQLSAKPKTKHVALAVGMYVMPSSRKGGSARHLLLNSNQYCLECGGIHVIKLGVTERNSPATKSYESLGFVPFGLKPMAILIADGFRSKLHMWLRLLA
jgi:GNAT superfamily N-acetyltransferase